MATMKHGTYNSYTNKKCRCEACTKAARDYMRKYRTTAKGRTNTRYYATLGSRRAQLAAEWVKTNHPDIWQSISEKAVSIVGNKPENQ
jgi:hypothetical protein